MHLVPSVFTRLLLTAASLQLQSSADTVRTLAKDVSPNVNRMWTDHVPEADIAAAPNTTISNMTYSAGKIFYYATHQVTRLGPITLPASGTNRNDLYRQSFPNAPKPCDNCVILFTGSELQDADGRRINANSDVFIRSTKIVNRGSTLPAIHQGSCTIANTDVFYETHSPGNHAIYYAPTDLSVKTGVHINLADRFEIEAAIVNKSKKRQHVWVAYTYEFLPGDNPEFGNSTFEIIGMETPACETDDGEPLAYPKHGIKFSEYANHTAAIRSAPRKAMFSGTIIKAKGQVGTDVAWLDLILNNRTICRSNPVNAEPSSPETDTGGWTSDVIYQGRTELVQMSECRLNETINKGDEWRVVAHYNLAGGVTPEQLARRAYAAFGVLISR